MIELDFRNVLSETFMSNADVSWHLDKVSTSCFVSYKQNRKPGQVSLIFFQLFHVNAGFLGANANLGLGTL
jgi:hypothetical protein